MSILMNHHFRWLAPTSILSVITAVVIISACSSDTPPVIPPTVESSNSYYAPTATASLDDGAVRGRGKPKKDPKDLLREVKLYKDLIPRGTHARKYPRKLNPRYITIHSTQNYASSADAWRHSLALKNGKLRARKSLTGNRIGYLVWHYTTDQNVAVQHLPDNEQGEHADFNGPGNNYSLAIEMCENSGNSRAATLERTARLTAYLMYKHDIPLQHVVPHQHWPRKGLSKPHKNCPHYLLDNGVPGAKWQWFLAKIKRHHDDITKPVYSSDSSVVSRF